MNLYEVFVLSVFDLSMSLILIYALINQRCVKISYKVAYIFTGALAIALVSSVITNEIASHLLSTLVVFTCVLVYLGKTTEIKLTSQVVMFCLVGLVMLVVQLLSIIIINFIVSDFSYSFYNGVLSQTLSLIIVLLVSKWSYFSNMYIYFECKSVVYSAIVLNLFLVYYVVSIFWFMDINNVIEYIVGLIVAVIFTMFINIVIFRESLINKAYKEKLEIYETYIPIVDNIMEAYKVKQHDYHNHIQTIITASKKMPNELSSELTTYIDEVIVEDIWTILLKLQNKIVMALLYSKYVSAKEKGINLEVEVDNFALKSEYTNYEIVEMYGGLIDNAIDATKEVNGESVQLFLKTKEGRNCFRVSNQSKSISITDANKFFEDGFSTKEKGNRGVGLGKVKRLINSKKGTIYFYYDASLGKVIAEILHA